MSVFSMIKRGRQAAKEHKAEQAKKEKEEAQKPPYKHIPRHAAIDALSGGPAGWRENDRLRIVEQNRRRSAMTASGVGMSGFMTPVHSHPGLPRVQSALSHVSYPAAYASPVVQMPRTYSYSSMPAGWTPHRREMSYSPVDLGSISLKGKEVERILDSSRTSRSSSKVSTGRVPFPPAGPFGNRDSAPSPVESSSNSTSSQDDLEMKPVVRHSLPVTGSASTSASRPSRPMSDTESIHRLHPGRSRRISDPNQSATTSRLHLAPRTTSLAADIPPVPALPPIQFGTAITTPDVFPSAASNASSIPMVAVGSSASLSAKGATGPSVLKVEEVDIPSHADITTTESSGEEEVATAKALALTPVGPIITPPDSPTRKNGRRTSKMTRFTELEPIHSNTVMTIDQIAAPPSPPLSQTASSEREKKRATSTVTALPTEFDESALPAPKEIVLPTSQPSPAPAKSGKLTKNSAAAGGKLVKKNRWSLRSSKNTAVAV